MSEKFHGVEIGLNHATTNTTKKGVIYLEDEDAVIAITIEEAEWLSKKLIEYVNKFN